MLDSAWWTQHAEHLTGFCAGHFARRKELPSRAKLGSQLRERTAQDVLTQGCQHQISSTPSVLTVSWKYSRASMSAKRCSSLSLMHCCWVCRQVEKVRCKAGCVTCRLFQAIAKMQCTGSLHVTAACVRRITGPSRCQPATLILSIVCMFIYMQHVYMTL